LVVAFHGHTASCYENPNSHIIYDLAVTDGNVFFFFFPPEDDPISTLQKRNKLKSVTCC
jgi:carotenoid cleavage dioxygenase